MILLVAGVQFVNILDFMMVMPLGPDFAIALGIPTAHIGYIGGAYTLAAAIAGMVGALFLDRFDRRKALAVAMLGLVAATALGGFAVGLNSLVGARLLAGAFGGPATAVALAIVSDVVPPERRGRALGTVMTAFSIASILGVPAGLRIGTLFGWRAPFFAVAALCLLVTVLAIFAMPSLTGHRTRLGEPPAAPLRIDRLMLATFVNTALTMVAVFAVVPNISTFLQRNLGYPREKLDVLYLVGGFAALATRAIGALVDRVGATRVISLGTLVFAAALYLGFVNPVSAEHVIWVFPLLMLSASLRGVPLNTLATRVPAPAERARFMSAQSSVQHLASTAGAVAAAAVLADGAGGRLENMELVAVAAIAVALLVPVVSGFVERGVRRREAARAARLTGRRGRIGEPMSSTLKAGRYEIRGVLGSGSQGETLDALDTTTGRRVAVKRFSVRGAASWKDVELAEREARVLQALEHPRLPRYIDHFEEDGALILVMERVEGESLAALRKRGGTLPRNEIVKMLADVGEVLDYLHGRAPPIIHRDIKPGNVIRKPDGSFCLVDFGSVRDSLKPEGGSTVVGTFGFMAPEQFQGRALLQSDVYALGATALSLLTAREPEELPHRGLAIDVARALPHDPTFSRVLTRMLDPDPDRRATRVAPLVAELAPPEPSFEAPRSWAPGPSARGSWRPDAYRRSEDRPSRTMKPLVPSALVMLVLIVGLVIARFSTGALFRVFLPILLTLLSVFFGGGLRRTASHMRRIGERGDEGLRRAMDVVRGRPPRRSERRSSSPRVRVEEMDEPELYDEESDAQRRWKRRGRR